MKKIKIKKINSSAIEKMKKIENTLNRTAIIIIKKYYLT